MNYLAPVRLAARAVLRHSSRPAHAAGHPEHRLLVGDPGGLHAGPVGVELGGDRPFGRGPCSASARCSGRWSGTTFGSFSWPCPSCSGPCQGVRSRHVALTAIGVAGHALLPSGICGDGGDVCLPAAAGAREPDAHAEVAAGPVHARAGLGALRLLRLPEIRRGAATPPTGSSTSFFGPSATVLQTLETSAEFLACGLGAWALFACLAPRVAILAVPWIWSLCNGRWAIRFLATEEWHHVRYAALPVAMILAAGLIGYARLGVWLIGAPARPPPAGGRLDGRRGRCAGWGSASSRSGCPGSRGRSVRRKPRRSGTGPARSAPKTA